MKIGLLWLDKDDIGIQGNILTCSNLPLFRSVRREPDEDRVRADVNKKSKEESSDKDHGK